MVKWLKKPMVNGHFLINDIIVYKGEYLENSILPDRFKIII